MGKMFRFEELPGRIGLLTLDVPDQKVNTFSQPVLEELAELVAGFEKKTDMRGLLFQSGKGAQGQFIAGADLKELAGMATATPEQAAKGIAAGHEIFDRISNLPFPTVALIDGQCMGGGTEITLAMDYRLASDGPKTQIGLPEVKVGLFPGWGGTQRLPRLIGIQHAINMICTGEPVDAAKAAAIGLVFDAVKSEDLVSEGCQLIEYAQKSGHWKSERQRLRQALGLSGDQMMFDFSIAQGYIYSTTKGQYPAPMAALQAMQEGINVSLAEGLKIEQKLFLGVIGTPVAANLINVFFMNNHLTRDPGVDDPKVKPRDLERVGVLGTGQMGAGIAAAHARSGYPTVMVDVDDNRLADGMRQATKVVTKRIEIGRATQEDLVAMLSRLSTSTSHQVFSDRDVVIEAVTENEKLKTSLYKQLAGVLKKDAILASNTSTISITRMAESAPDPTRFVGMHFFFPVDRMQLVEVIRGKKTSDETVATIVQLAKKIRKTPIVVNDCPGFLVNRVLLPYMVEAVVLVMEGASIDQVDKAAERFGMPVGPMALHDMVGIDTSFYAGQVLAAGYPDRAVNVPIMEALVKAGRLGKKSGAGFRKYEGEKGRPVADPEIEPLLDKYRTDRRSFQSQELTDRLFLPMLIEAVRVLEDGIVRQPAHVDMGLIYGVGFPPFKGGILRWCDTLGADKVVKTAEKYAKLGVRFQTPQMLKEMAATGKKFYPAPTG